MRTHFGPHRATIGPYWAVLGQCWAHAHIGAYEVELGHMWGHVGHTCAYWVICYIFSHLLPHAAYAVSMRAEVAPARARATNPEIGRPQTR